jgi:hypothetical protein
MFLSAIKENSTIPSNAASEVTNVIVEGKIENILKAF